MEGGGGGERQMRRQGRWSQQGQKVEEWSRYTDRRGGEGDVEVDKQGGGRQGRREWRAECSSSISLSFSSFLHSLPGANELLMAVETGAMDQSSTSLCSLCFFLSPFLLPPVPPPLFFFALSPPGFLAGPQLAPTHLLHCLSADFRRRSGRLS